MSAAIPAGLLPGHLIMLPWRRWWFRLLLLGLIFVTLCLIYFDWQRRQAAAANRRCRRASRMTTAS
jgi:hypothetical protein